MSPLFSIATPTYNQLGKLRRCVGSVRGQSDVTLEHLVQDAASNDGTPEWLLRQPDLLARSESDAGMYDGITRAWARSRGSILSWLNSDEQYLPGVLSKVAQYFAAHPGTDILFGDYIVCDAAGSPVALRREIPFRQTYVCNSFLYSASCTLFFRRRLLESGLLRFDTSLRYAADMDLLLRLDRHGVRIDHLRAYIGLFGIDGGNLSAHPQMQREAEEVRQRHGAFRNPYLREAMLLARRIERVVSGSYARQRAKYLFALDETPNYKHVVADRIGGRYSLDDSVTR